MLSGRTHRLLALLGRAGADRRGVAAVEFAFVAPLMILLYFGLAQISQAIIASRHANHSASSVGDLVAQCAKVSDGDLSNMFAGGGDMMTPLPVGAGVLSQSMTSVAAIDSKGTTQVQWSEASNGGSSYTPAAGPYAPKQSYTLPSNISSNLGQGDSVIVEETIYKYAFPFTAAGLLPMGANTFSLSFGQAITFDIKTYFKPRESSVVTYTGAGPGGTSDGTSCYAS